MSTHGRREDGGPPTTGANAALYERLPRLRFVARLAGPFLIHELRAGAPGTMTGFPLPDRLASSVRLFSADPGHAKQARTGLPPLMRLEAFTPCSLKTRQEVGRQRWVIRSARCRRGERHSRGGCGATFAKRSSGVHTRLD